MSDLRVCVVRRASSQEAPYTETFSVPQKKDMTVLDVLSAIQLNPRNLEGKDVAPVAWECNCQEEVCGACAMNICGLPKMACSTLVREVVSEGKALVLAPLEKFPVIRDLVVDKSSVYETYKRLKIYASPVRESGHVKTEWKVLYDYTRCMSCGICREVCPNTGVNRLFSGASGLSIMRSMCEANRLKFSAFADKGGVAECSGHSLCAKYCPKKIDLPAAISYANRKAAASLFSRKG